MKKTEFFDLITKSKTFAAFQSHDPESFAFLCRLAEPPAPSQKQLRIFLCTFALLEEAFDGDRKKIWAWWTQALPGRPSPRSLLLDGKTKRLASLITRKAIHKPSPPALPHAKIYREALHAGKNS